MALIHELLHNQVEALVLERAIVKYDIDVGISSAVYTVEVHLKTGSKHLEIRRELKEALQYTFFNSLSQTISLNMNKRVHLTRLNLPSLLDLIKLSGVPLEVRGAVTFDFLHRNNPQQNKSFYISNREMKREWVVTGNVAKFPSMDQAVAVKMLLELEQKRMLEFRKKSGERVEGLYPLHPSLVGGNSSYNQQTLL